MAKKIYEAQGTLNQQHLEIQRELKEWLEGKEAALAVCEKQLHMCKEEIQQLQQQIHGFQSGSNLHL